MAEREDGMMEDAGEDSHLKEQQNTMLDEELDEKWAKADFDRDPCRADGAVGTQTGPKTILRHFPSMSCT